LTGLGTNTAPMPAPSMMALAGRSGGSETQVLERPSSGMNPMIGVRMRPPSMRVLQARAY